MNHHDHLNLLRGGIPYPGGVWADLGSGTGAFTLALADLLGRDGTIYSIDKDRAALRQQEQTMSGRFPHLTVHYHPADFTTPLDLPPLDGIIIANALHFLSHKEPTLRLIHNYLQPGGRLLLVEYNTDHGNSWVPYPLTYPTWQQLAHRTGFSQTQLLATHPSRFLGEIFSVVSVKSGI